MALPKLPTFSVILRGLVLLGLTLGATQSFGYDLFRPHKTPHENKDVYAHPYPHPHPEQWKQPVYEGDAKIFYEPMMGKVHLDFCFKHNKFCGRSAANKFCKKQGYDFASRFFIKRNVGKTKTIGDKRLHYKRRDGFRLIKCRSNGLVENKTMDKFGKNG